MHGAHMRESERRCGREMRAFRNPPFNRQFFLNTSPSTPADHVHLRAQLKLEDPSGIIAGQQTFARRAPGKLCKRPFIGVASRHT